MTGVSIRYGDIAVGAREAFIPRADDKAPFVDLSQLQRDRLSFPNFQNPCDLYTTPLDGSALGIPPIQESPALGLWSEQISRVDGSFETPIVLELNSTEYFESSGLTLIFDVNNSIYATSVNIEWYEDGDIISEMRFSPDSPKFYCENKVEHYNGLIITFYGINMPESRLKLNGIEYGSGINIYGAELRNVKLIQAIDPISSEISINTCDFVLDTKSDYEFEFQIRQPLEIYFNGILKATTFVRNSRRTARRMWHVESEDYIGLLDTIPFYGGIYSNYSGKSLLRKIFDTAKVPFNLKPFDDVLLSGYIPFTTCRNALMQVCFALGVVADTSNSDVINVFALDNEITQTIPLKRIMQGQNFEKSTRVTAVELTSHAYRMIDTSVTAYDSEKSGTGEEIFVVFTEPLHSLSITNGDILESHPNYAIINADDDCILTGKQYEHNTVTHTKLNPNVLLTDIENVVAIQQATLITSTNVDQILNLCYNHIIKDTTINLKIVEGKHDIQGDILYGTELYNSFVYGGISSNQSVSDQPVVVGEKIEVETEYLGNIKGRAVKQTFNLNGGIIVKDTVMIGD